MKTSTALLLAFVAVTSSSTAGILAGPITNSANQHVYYLLTATNWNNAEKEAVALGGHLATINDSAENAWVYANFVAYTGNTNRLMIGLTDKFVEGSFQWISGDPSTYRAWAGNEPNNSNGGEDFVWIWTAGGGDGHWNDFVGSDKQPGVVEIIPGIASLATIQTAVEITWTTQTTNRYQVQWCSALETNNWFNLGPEVAGSGSTNRMFDSIDGAGQKFYRVLTVTP